MDFPAGQHHSNGPIYHGEDAFKGADERGSCEPECSDLAPGEHHPNCSTAALALEAEACEDLNDITGSAINR